MSHSFLPPSGAAAWSRCSLWPTMNKLFPQLDTSESIEGTAAHWVLTEELHGRQILEGSKTPDGVIVTGEMVEGAELACDAVFARVKPSLVLHTEETVHIPEIHAECFGTPDAWAFDVTRLHLDIFDYKFGHGYVDEYFNPQGLCYLLGILDLIPKQCVWDVRNVVVSFTIIQPRCYVGASPVRTHTFRVGEIDAHVARLQTSAHAAHDPKPTATTNEECDYCPGRHACTALQQAAYRAAEISNNRIPLELTPAAASLELRMLERAQEQLNARVEGLREQTFANLSAGKSVPHHGLAAGRGKRVWTKTPDEIFTLGELFGKDLRKITPMTPTQAEKYIDREVITAYIESIPGAQKLVPQNNENVRRVFGAGE